MDLVKLVKCENALARELKISKRKAGRIVALMNEMARR